MITPKLEPGKRYPVFFQHYGGPHVADGEQGLGRGAPAISGRSRLYLVPDRQSRIGQSRQGIRGRDLHAMGSVEVEDQVAGANYLKTLGFVDPDKIATYGWSYGGYMTLKMLEGAPGVFAAGVAGAPVTKWELYDTFYTERYMGDPTKVPEAYAASDNIGNAAKISDPLLILHGMADDNVVLEHTTAMASTLQKAKVPFEMMLYPGQTHRVGGPGISEHLWGTILNFLDRHTSEAKK
jgi:dipeptidyl-peptidase-4